MMRTDVDAISDNLMSIYSLLYRNLAKPLRKKTTVTPGGLFVMSYLKRKGLSSMSDIGKSLMIPKPHVTVLVDKLIEEEYVERRDDLNDRRIVNILLTEKGQNDFEEIKQVISETLKEKLSTLKNNQIQQLMACSQNVRETLNNILTND
jgi:DNA-binding MarR family transcriptional regulator